MKKLIAIILMAVCIFNLSACSNKKQKVSSVDNTITIEEYLEIASKNPLFFAVKSKNDSIPFGLAMTLNLIQDGYNTEITNNNDIIENNIQEKRDFKDALFIGDSITVAFKDYIENNNITNLKEAVYFARGGFAIRHNRQTVNSESMHPEYNGEKMKISKLIKEANKGDLFISLGTNDLVVNSPSVAKSDLVTLLNAILSVKPDIKIHIIETVKPTNPGKDKLTADNVIEYNKLVKEYAISKNYEYIELPKELFKEDGSLKEEYSSDNFTHLNEKAYNLITKKLLYK